MQIPEFLRLRLAEMIDLRQQGNYDLGQDPLYNRMYKADVSSDSEPSEPMTGIHYYECDHLKTLMELTDDDGNIVGGKLKSVGVARLTVSEAGKKTG